MRFVLILAFVALVAAPQAFAGTPDKYLDARQINALEAKAQHADAKEKCYLYARLVSAMAWKADRDLSTGDRGAMSTTLKAIRHYTAKIHAAISAHSKKLKDAQIMMDRTAFRLNDLMKSSSLEDQQSFATTLSQLNQVQSQMMLAVFQK